MLASPGPSWLQLLLASGWLDLVYVCCDCEYALKVKGCDNLRNNADLSRNRPAEGHFNARRTRFATIEVQRDYV